MKRSTLAKLSFSAAATALIACGDMDVDGLYEDEGHSDRGGIGVSEQALVTGPVTIDVRRSLAVTDKVILNAFTLQAVMDKLAAQSGVLGLTGTQLFKQLWDTQNPTPGSTLGPHCNDTLVNGQPAVNGFPYACRSNPSEGGQATNPSTEIANYTAIGLFNRFDLAPANGADCGEYRIVFARTAGGGRNFIIFEAVLANPRTDLGLDGCRPVANLWRDLSSDNAILNRRNTLQSFYMNGLPGFMPVVHVENFGILGSGRSTTGQVRTNQFMGGQPWMLREFKLNKTTGPLGQLVFKPVTDKTNPFGGLFAAGSTQPLAAEFQNVFFPSQVAALAVNDINAFNYSVPDKFNTAESNSQTGSVDRYTDQFSATSTFAANIQSRLDAINSQLSPANIVARAKALSCAGCHQLSNGEDLGGGLPRLNSLQFVHVSELIIDHTGPDGDRFQISDSLKQVFLPHRKAVFESYLNQAATTPILSGVLANRCLDVVNGSAAPETRVQIADCTGAPGQNWTMNAAGEIRSALGTDLCLEVQGDFAFNGAIVQTNTCTGLENQKWTRTAVGELRTALNSSLCLDVPNGSTQIGTNVQTLFCVGGSRQQWFEQPKAPNNSLGLTYNTTINGVRLNGGSNMLVGATAGQSIQIAVDYRITQPQSCPNCADQIVVGFPSQPLGCVFNGVPSTSGTTGTGTLNITAPSAKGVYYLRYLPTMENSCNFAPWSTVPPGDDRNIAVVTVQ